jgi:hypothetical protein
MIERRAAEKLDQLRSEILDEFRQLDSAFSVRMA